MRVLDTAALLHWPVSELTGNVCAVRQQEELERVSPQRWMLVQALDIDWRDVPPNWLNDAKECAADSGDLPRLSDVDLDVLALALTLKYGSFGIFIAAFSPIPYKVFGWVAGMGEMEKKPFLLAGLCGRGVR